MTATTFAPGTVIAERYRIDGRLGDSATAEVFAATHVDTGARVAIKMVGGDDVSAHRLVRDAKTTAQLTGEHFVRVIDVGLHDERPFIATELVERSDLAAHATDGLPVGVAIDLVLQACDALAEVHALGVVHRDLEPANLVVTLRADGTPRLQIDFGFARGTPSYMSPEVLRAAREVDARADLWSLGVILYELIEGALPFDAESFAVLVVKIMIDRATPMQRAVEPGLARAIERCLHKDPAARFTTAAELVAAIAPYAGDLRAAAGVLERARRHARRPSDAVAPLAAPAARSKPGVQKIRAARGRLTRVAMAPIAKKDVP